MIKVLKALLSAITSIIWILLIVGIIIILLGSCSQSLAPASTGSCAKPGHEISITEYWQKKKAKKERDKKRKLRQAIEDAKPKACYGYFAKPFIIINHD